MRSFEGRRCRRQFRFSFLMVYRGVKRSLMSSIASFNAWNIGIVSQLRACVTHPPSLVFRYAQQLQQINRSNEEFRENFGGLNIFLNSEPRGNCYERFLFPLKEFTNRLISRTNLSKIFFSQTCSTRTRLQISIDVFEIIIDDSYLCIMYEMTKQKKKKKTAKTTNLPFNYKKLLC